jgi:hypothetical protein
MSLRVDPHAWNLLAGLCLAASGCGNRIIVSDDGDTTTSAGESDTSTSTSTSTDTSTSSTSTETTDESESNGPECMQDSDCPCPHDCIEGMCVGYCEAECFYSSECDSLELCLNYYCEPVLELAPCRPTAESFIPLEVGQQPLALSFVDLDADGAAELVVATQTELHAFESGSDVASVSARAYESPSVAAMVAGDFEPDPGQDLALLVDDTLLIHPSDGLTGFGPPSEAPSPELDSTGMLAGDFDGVAPTDLLVWGGNGATVVASEVFSLLFGPAEILVAAAHDLSTGSGYFVLRQNLGLSFKSLEGEPIATTPQGGGGDKLVALKSPSQLDVNATEYTGGSETWTLFEVFDLNQVIGQWGVNGAISAMTSGDLDGDGRDEVALIHDGGVTLIDNVATGNECTTSLDLGGATGATHLAIGDWDGDGDSELAVAFDGAQILVFDGEG